MRQTNTKDKQAVVNRDRIKTRTELLVIYKSIQYGGLSGASIHFPNYLWFFVKFCINFVLICQYTRFKFTTLNCMSVGDCNLNPLPTSQTVLKSSKHILKERVTVEKIFKMEKIKS